MTNHTNEFWARRLHSLLKFDSNISDYLTSELRSKGCNLTKNGMARYINRQEILNPDANLNDLIMDIFIMCSGEKFKDVYEKTFAEDDARHSFKNYRIVSFFENVFQIPVEGSASEFKELLLFCYYATEVFTWKYSPDLALKIEDHIDKTGQDYTKFVSSTFGSNRRIHLAKMLMNEIIASFTFFHDKNRELFEAATAEDVIAGALQSLFHTPEMFKQVPCWTYLMLEIKRPPRLTKRNRSELMMVDSMSNLQITKSELPVCLDLKEAKHDPTPRIYQNFKPF